MPRPTRTARMLGSLLRGGRVMFSAAALAAAGVPAVADEPFAPEPRAAAGGFSGSSAAGGSAGVTRAFAGVRSVVTRRPAFALPTGLLGDRTELVAVRLFVSRDGGTAWETAATAPGDAARLEFEAVRDGNYWFCVRGLDRRGGTHPPDALVPQYRVTVDTAPPVVDLRTWWAGESRLKFAATVEDAALSRDSLVLRYVPADPAADWVTVEPAPGEVTSWDGLLRLDLDRELATPFDVTVRLTVRDAAENETVVVRTLPRPGAAAASAPGGFGLLRFDDPAAGTPLLDPAGPDPLDPAADPLVGGGGVRPASAQFPVARFRLPGANPAATPAPLPGVTTGAADDGAGETGGLYAELLRRDPADRDLRLAYAAWLTRRGDAAAAADQYRRLLAADPGDAAVLRRLTDLTRSAAGTR